MVGGRNEPLMTGLQSSGAAGSFGHRGSGTGEPLEEKVLERALERFWKIRKDGGERKRATEEETETPLLLFANLGFKLGGGGGMVSKADAFIR